MIERTLKNEHQHIRLGKQVKHRYSTNSSLRKSSVTFTCRYASLEDAWRNGDPRSQEYNIKRLLVDGSGNSSQNAFSRLFFAKNLQTKLMAKLASDLPCVRGLLIFRSEYREVNRIPVKMVYLISTSPKSKTFNCKTT